MHTGPSGLYSVFLPIHLAAHPTNSVQTPTKSTYIHIQLPTTPFGLRPYPSTISVWALWPYPSIPQLCLDSEPLRSHFFLFWTNLRNSDLCLSITYGQHSI